MVGTGLTLAAVGAVLAAGFFEKLFSGASPEIPNTDLSREAVFRFLEAHDAIVRARMRARSWHKVDDLAHDFLAAQLSGEKSPRPGEYLSGWKARVRSVDPSLEQRASEVVAAVREWLSAREKEEETRQRATQQVESAEARLAAAALADEILARHQARVKTLLELAHREAGIRDEYGDTNPEAFAEELERFLEKLRNWSQRCCSTGRARTSRPCRTARWRG